MNGYATLARVEAPGPRIADRGTTVSRPNVEVTAFDRAVILDVAGPTGGLRERWAAIRDRVGQLTFYLTDPDSWR